ncbi:MAG TPA: imidazolonepropionase [Nitriliruptorales bacterium]|nr:imidazolonepropionase [Nitriliruptorales bacterium]
MTAILLRNIGRLITAVDPPVRVGAALCVEGDRIVWIGGDHERPPTGLGARVAEEVDVGGGLVTPGLIDAHTHPVYAGQRFAEFTDRSAGRAYDDLGTDAGIWATVRATRTAAAADLETLVQRRLASWLWQGTTTVEAKTGYHLERDGELADVRLLDRLRRNPALPDLSITFLAAHAVPPEAAGDADSYTERAAGWSGDAAAEGADGCDVFCDRGYFSVRQAHRILTAGAAAGLTSRIHADELARTGGARLAAELGAASADHLLRSTRDDAAALAAAGVVATLCPATALSMGARPDVAALRAAGTTLALGSDHNPGTSGVTSMSLVVALAVGGLGLSVHEALRAATVGGARSLRLPDRGTVAVGQRADLVWWDAEHEGAFGWAWGLRPHRVWRAGRSVDRPGGAG